MSPKLSRQPRSAWLCDVGNSLAAKNAEAMRPNKQRQPAKLPLIQQLQARKAWSLSVNLVTKKKGGKKSQKAFSEVQCQQKRESWQNAANSSLIMFSEKVYDLLQGIPTWFWGLRFSICAVISSEEERKFLLRTGEGSISIWNNAGSWCWIYKDQIIKHETK